MFDHVRSQWPGATVLGSTLEFYLDGLLEEVHAGGVNLPVVTGLRLQGCQKAKPACIAGLMQGAVVQGSPSCM